MDSAIITAVLSFLGMVVGNLLAHSKTTALVTYRLKKLEEKQDKHNNLIERMYKLEETCSLLDEKIQVANNKIKELGGIKQ